MKAKAAMKFERQCIHDSIRNIHTRMCIFGYFLL